MTQKIDAEWLIECLKTSQADAEFIMDSARGIDEKLFALAKNLGGATKDIITHLLSRTEGSTAISS